MHCQTNINSVNAKQSKEIHTYQNGKRRLTNLLQVYGITRHAETNNYRQTTSPSRLTAIIDNVPILSKPPHTIDPTKKLNFFTSRKTN
jgi:hypothetical protein